MTDQSSVEPVEEFQSASIRASVWRYRPHGPEDLEGEHYTVRIGRQYLTDEGSFAESPYFTAGDLPHLRSVAEAAYQWLAARRAQDPAAEPPAW